VKKIKGISILKAVVTFVCLFFVVRQVHYEYTDLGSFSIPDFFGTTVFVLLILMIINWCLEVLRWKISIGSFERFDLKSAFIDVFGGLAMNWVLPFTSGDFVVRLGGKENKKASVIVVLINRGIMLSLTTLLGVYGLRFLVPFHISLEQGLIATSLFVSIVLLVWILKVRKWDVLTTLSRRVVIQIFTLSLLRYIIFTLQFFILFKLFNPGLADDYLIGGIGWIFLIRSAIPSLLGGLGVRETSAMFYFQGVVHSLSLVLFPVFLLWVINTVLPSLIGASMIWKLRFKIAGAPRTRGCAVQNFMLGHAMMPQN